MKLNKRKCEVKASLEHEMRISHSAAHRISPQRANLTNQGSRIESNENVMPHNERYRASKRVDGKGCLITMFG